MPCQQWEMYSQRQRLRHRQRRMLTQAAAAKRALVAAFVRRNLLHLLLPTRSKIFTDIPKQLMKWTNMVNFPKPFTAFTVSMNHYVSFSEVRSARSVETSPFKLSESLEKLQQKLPETLVQLGASTLSTSPTVAENP